MKKILYFVNGFAPSKADLKAAKKIDGEVLYRNVQLFDESAPLEACDGVAGVAPAVYVEAFNPKPEKVTFKEPVSKESE